MAYIALFDILGFKQTIFDTPLEELKKVLGDEFNELLDMTISFSIPDGRKDSNGNIERTREYCSYIRFSDTIIIFSDDETDICLGHILLAARKLIGFMIIKGLPVRGAITKGELYVDTNNSLVLGEGLIRAYELEQIQEWSGAIVDPVRIEVPDDLYEEYRSLPKFWEYIAQTKMLYQYKPPLKTNTCILERVWCIAWPLENMPINHLAELLTKSNPLTPESTTKELTSDAKIKINNTIDFFDSYKTWYDNLWFQPNMGNAGGWFQHTTCHVCDQGFIKYPEGCPGCGNVSGQENTLVKDRSIE
jgi:hypothetical protein